MQAGIYARISQDQDGTELGVTRQQEDCRREADRRGWEVVAHYVDNDVSATRSKVRPEYERMLRDIRSGRIQAVVVWDIDRLTRTPREIEDVIDFADTHKLSLANVGGDIDLSTSDGRMMARIKGALARAETEKMGRRLRRRFQQKAELGEPHGFAPYGYKRVHRLDENGNPRTSETKVDVIVPEEAAIIRECARRVLNRESLRSIIADLNARGVHGPKAPVWNSTILRQILLRPTNAGFRQYQGKTIGKANTEPVYDVLIHNQLVALLRDPSRRSNRVGPGYKYLLSGIAICGLCGGPMRRQVGHTATSARTGASKRQPPSYNCSVCFKVRRKQEPVDHLVSEVLISRLSLPDAIGLFAVSDDVLAKEAQAALDAIDAKLAVAADQFAEDSLTADQLKRITSRLRSDRTRHEAQLQAAKPNTVLTALAGGDVRRKWEALSIAGRREAAEALMSVTILPSGSGQRFDPEDVVIAWLT